MKKRRVPPLPTEPTLVLSSVLSNDHYKLLQQIQPEAVMESFEVIRKPGYDERMDSYFTWPARLFLDSGLFSVMTKAGTHRIQSGLKSKHSYDFRELVGQLRSDFVGYLTRDFKRWHHIVEMDTDTIPELGPEYALEVREQLHELVGNRLLPVWHFASESVHGGSISQLTGWRRMVAEYPFVAIGGDKVEDKQLYRHMTRIAHANGTIVHRLGCTDPQDALEVGWDTGDSTNWLRGARFGNFMLFNFGRKVNSAQDASKHQRIQDFVRSRGLDPDVVLFSGHENSTRSKYLLGALIETDRQDYLRKYRKLGVD